MRPLEVRAGAMVTNLGFSAAAVSAALRGGLDNFVETRFLDRHGDRLTAAQVPLDPPLRGRARLLELARLALTQTLEETGAGSEADLPLLLCLAGAERPGRAIGDERGFFADLEIRTGRRFAAPSRIFPVGKAAVASAVASAERLLYDGAHDRVLVLAVDSLLTARDLRHCDAADRLLTRTTSNGFVPGEGAASAVLERRGVGDCAAGLSILGYGLGAQPAPTSRAAPLRADGLVEAMRAALREAGVEAGAIGFRGDDNDIGYRPAKEATLAELRLLRGEGRRVVRYGPIAQLGETGAASPLFMALLFPDMAPAAGSLGLLTAAGDGPERAALVVRREH